MGSFGAELEVQAKAYQAALHAAGHPPEVTEECLRFATVDWKGVVISEDESELPGLIEAARAEHAVLRAKLPGAVRQVAAGGPNLISGTPEQIAEQVQGLHEGGIQHLLTRFLGEWHGETRPIAERSMRLFAEQVIPRFAHSLAHE